MNWWMLAAGLSALICTVGHAIVGVNMFYRPIKAVISDALHAGVLSGMWHLITVHFALSALVLMVTGVYGRQDLVGWFIAAQFASYAVVYLAISLSLGGFLKLFPWTLFAATAVLTAIGAHAAD
jgi:hypothetical protein